MKRLTQTRIWAGNGSNRARAYSIGPGRVGVTCAIGPIAAHGNQDAAAAIPIDSRTAVLVVADGIGGEAGGEIVSRFAVETIRLYVEILCPTPENLDTLIIDALRHANDAILKSAHLGGTTAIVAVVRDDTLNVFHAGDSRGIMTDSTGKIIFQTLDHTVTQDKIDAGLIEADDASRDLHRHLLTNALGDPTMEVECSEAIPIAPNATLLLATDGLTDNLEVERITVLSRTRGMERLVDTLVDEACAHMISPDVGDGLQPKPDNITVLAYRPSRNPRPPAG